MTILHKKMSKNASLTRCQTRFLPKLSLVDFSCHFVVNLICKLSASSNASSLITRKLNINHEEIAISTTFLFHSQLKSVENYNRIRRGSHSFSLKPMEAQAVLR